MKIVEFGKKLLSLPRIADLVKKVAAIKSGWEVYPPTVESECTDWADIHNLCVSAFGAILRNYRVDQLLDGGSENHGTRITLTLKSNTHWAIRDAFTIAIEHRTVPTKDATGHLWRKGLYARIGVSAKGYSQSNPLVSSKKVDDTRKYVKDFLDSQLDANGLAYWEKTGFSAEFEAIKRKYARKGIRVVGSLSITRRP
jgi:hypothetical protein